MKPPRILAQCLRFGPFRLDLAPRRLWRKNTAIAIQPRPLAVLAYLVEHADRVVSKEELLAEIWAGTVVSPAVLKVAVRAIREALGEDAAASRYIETVGRDGYRFRLSSSDDPSDLRAAQSLPATVGPLSESTDSPIVGRAALLDRLSISFRRASRGERQLVFLAGEAGIGKTMLAERFVRSLRRTVIGWGQCVEQYGEGEAYLPVIEALHQICRGPYGRMARDVLGRCAPTWLAQLASVLSPAEMEALAPRLADVSRPRMLRELAEALEALSSREPVVLVLEDLHVSDPSTVEALAYIARRRGRAHLLILGTYRPAAGATRQHPLRTQVPELKTHHQCAELTLSGLSPRDVQEYLAHRLGTRMVPEALVGELHARTDGLPLFLVNIVDYLVGLGALRRDPDGAWRLVRAPDSWETPDTLRDLIANQLDVLAPEELNVLDVASVAGVEFSVDTVARVMGKSADHVEAICDTLASRSLLREQALNERPDGTVTGRYRFHHALHQNVLYRRLPEARRVMLHRAIGEIEEAANADRARDFAPALAMHFERGRNPDRAAHYRAEAAEVALARHAYREALLHAVRGVELLSERPRSVDRSRRQLGLEFASLRALNPLYGHDSSEVHAAYLRARALCEEVGTRHELAYVLLGLFRYHNTRMELSTAREIAAQAFAVAEREGDGELIVGGCYAVGVNAFFRGDLATAHDYLARGVEESRPDHFTRHLRHYGFDLGMGCAIYLALSLWFLGYPDRARQVADAVLANADQRLDPLSLASVRSHAAWVYRLCRRRADAEKQTQRCAELLGLTTRAGFPFWITIATAWWALDLVEQGQVVDGVAKLEQALARDRAPGASSVLVFLDVLLAEAYVTAGRPDEALAALDLAEHGMAMTDQRFLEADLYRIRGQAIAKADRTARPGVLSERACACFTRALEIARRQASRSLELRALTTLARLQPSASVCRELQKVYDWFTEGFDTADLVDAAATLTDMRARGLHDGDRAVEVDSRRRG